MNESNPRILVIDDNPSIHDDLRKILVGAEETKHFVREAEAILFEAPAEAVATCRFEIDSAFQGQEGLQKVEQSLAAGRPYAMAFVDVRMPPGWDGVETITRIWKCYPELQVVICTAYSDYSWRDIVKTLGRSDGLLILKKPFDSIEVLQLAHALTTKWELAHQVRDRLEDLDRKVNERTEALRASEERFSRAFNSSPLPMVIQSLNDERLVDANESFLTITGLTREELKGHSLAELPLWTKPEVGREIQAILQRQQRLSQFPCQLQTRAGKIRETILFAEVFHLGQVPHALLLAEDVTDRLELENQLRQAHKMEAVGQLAAGVAHDFNNMLTIIQGQISLILDTKQPAGAMEKPLRHVLGASERASMLTRQLLAFSRKQMIQRRPIKLHTLLEQHGQMLHRLIGEHIQLDILCPPDLPAVFADSCNLEQVIMNLAVNSRDAMPQGGRLTIRAEAAQIGPEHQEATPDASPGHYVRLEVSDTGCGMDPATQKRLFEPFFTTKEVGKGTGMGLATVYGIIKQHQGWIDVKSAVGQGTTFSVFLPLAAETLIEDAAPASAPVPVPPNRGKETILVVEDEPFLREFVETVLQDYGYRILIAADAHEALRVWGEHDGQIDLLLTDMVMPGGMSGRELVEQLSAHKPDLRAIYTSGYSRDVLGAELKWDDERTFLQKPYQSAVLVQTVRDCLDEETGCAGLVNNRWTALN